MAAFLPAAATAQLLGSKGGHWRPQPTTTAWQWQLQGRLDLSVEAPVFDVDGFETGAAGVRALHRRGRKVICYLDVGSWESYRPDARPFPPAVIGRRYEGFSDERWLDVSRYRLFASPLRRRIEMCARKGFDAVEPDNLAGWENDTGFAITAAEQFRFNRWIAAEVHRRGMAVALKNDGGQASALLPGAPGTVQQPRIPATTGILGFESSPAGAIRLEEDATRQSTRCRPRPQRGRRRPCRQAT